MWECVCRSLLVGACACVGVCPYYIKKIGKCRERWWDGLPFWGLWELMASHVKHTEGNEIVFTI